MQTRLGNDSSEYNEMNVEGDKAGLSFRQKMLEWVLEEFPVPRRPQGYTNLAVRHETVSAKEARA